MKLSNWMHKHFWELQQIEAKSSKLEEGKGTARKKTAKGQKQSECKQRYKQD